MTGSAIWKTNPEGWLAAIVESSDDAIVGKTLDGIIRSWNAGAMQVFGYAPEEIIGRSVLTLIPVERHDEEREIVSRLSRGERISHFETVRVRKDGSLVDVSLSVSPIRDASGAVVGATKIARDVSEAKRLRRVERELTQQLQQQALELEQQVEEAQSLQEELEQTNDELQRTVDIAAVAQRAAEEANRAKSQFLATMSHELRTPLNAIAGYVDLLDLGLHGSLNDQQRSYLERVKINQQTLLRLIDDILDLAKLEAGRVEYDFVEFRIDDLLRTLEAFIAPTLQQKRLHYHFEPCGSDTRAYADRDKTEQVLLNLLSNALKFTDAGQVTVRCVDRGDRVHIEVTDTGQGVRPELLDIIFEPFVQGDAALTRAAKGTGLGLSISRQLARDMGGDLLAASELGKGSTFALVLPTVRAAGSSQRTS